MALEQWLVDGAKTIDLATVRRVRANLVGGRIAVIAHHEPGSRIEVESTTVRSLKVAMDGDTLVIDHPQWDWAQLGESAQTLWNRPKAEISVLVPADVELNLSAASADVLVVGVTGRVKVKTVMGEQFLDRTGGRLTLNSVDGEVSVRDHRGEAAVQTVAGDITVAGELTGVSANSVSGSIVVDVTSGLPDRIATKTVSGSSTVRIPDDVTPHYRVQTATAVAYLEGEPTQPSKGKPFESARAEYTSRLTEVSLSSIGGAITVVRGPAPTREAQEGAIEQTTDAPRGPFRKIVPEGFHERLDERVDQANDHLGVPNEQAAPTHDEQGDDSAAGEGAQA